MVEVKVSILMARGVRVEYCEEYGVDTYAVNEGLLSMDDKVEVHTDFIRDNF